MTRPTVGEQYYELPDVPGRIASLDIFGPLPKTAQGFKYILVIMDQFSKFVKLYLMKDQKLDTIIDVLNERFFEDVGIPETILTDNGGQFITRRWQKFAEERGFTGRKTSPYNPQSNPVERVIREIGKIVRTYASERQYTWNRIIERAENVINFTVHSSTGYTQTELHNGEPSHLEMCETLLPEIYEEVALPEKIAQARGQLREAAEKRARQARKHGIAKTY